MARAPHTVLLISREDAEQRMRQRIDMAKTVLSGDRWSSDELRAGEERERAWRVYNRELLARIFSTDEFASEYDSAAVPINQIGDRYIDVYSNTIAGRILESVRKQVARPESIIDRLAPTPLRGRARRRSQATNRGPRIRIRLSPAMSRCGSS
jgi:hypothetical protein